MRNLIKIIAKLVNPLRLQKVWQANFGDWSGGRFKSFWTKKKAMEYAKDNKVGWLFVWVKNLITGERIDIYMSKEKPPPVTLPKNHPLLNLKSGNVRDNGDGSMHFDFRIAAGCTHTKSDGGNYGKKEQPSPNG